MKSIANYEIIKTIAESGPSAVYVARHKKLGRKTLLKVYSGADKALIERFEREARIVADLNSDAIVAIYDFGEDDGRFFISMEYIDGWNLQDYLSDHKPDVAEVIDFSYQISYCLTVLHQKGYIHRDLKPENILVDRQKRIKLTDFGLTLHQSLNRITSDGDLLGTPLYMSPEQINNRPLTPASDVFSMGIIFYQMASGTNPFEAGQVGEVFSKILTYTPPHLSDIQPSLPQWYAELVMRLLEKEAGKRPPTAAEVFLRIKEKSLAHQNNDLPAVLRDEEKPRIKTWGIYVALFTAILTLGYFYGFEYIKDSFWLSRDSIQQAPKFAVTDSQKILQPDTLPPANETISRPDNEIGMATNQTSSDSNPATGQLPEEDKTTFFVKTYPWCNIFLDYRLVGTTPMAKPIHIKPGKYILGLQNPNYPSYTDTIRIEAFKANSFAYNLDSLLLRVDLQVLPWGNVYIDDKYIGTTPLQKPLYLAPGKYIIRVTNDFYPTWVDTIVYLKNSSNRKRIVLDLKNRKHGIN
ncbi:MAG TPA: serine/threonine protein kinase [Caldithrix abyssi]|uniref:Serine/threonine protein kinase n=1 Tax=Caldithrix abyssi TaxID=187145 RepID=A0A7V4WV00_CALAY|nr:serine/threonine protein kinase [Caldithrix abyssi]